MPTIVTCCRTSDRLKGEEALADEQAEEDDAERAARSAAPASGWRAGCAGRACSEARAGRPRTGDRCSALRRCRRLVVAAPAMPVACLARRSMEAGAGHGGARRRTAGRAAVTAAVLPVIARVCRACGVPSISPSTCFSPSAEVIEGTPSTGLSVISFDAGIEEVEACGRLRLLAGLGEVGDRLDAQRGHLQRILHARSRRSCRLDVLHARAAAVDGDDQHVLRPCRPPSAPA